MLKKIIGLSLFFLLLVGCSTQSSPSLKGHATGDSAVINSNSVENSPANNSNSVLVKSEVPVNSDNPPHSPQKPPTQNPSIQNPSIQNPLSQKNMAQRYDKPNCEGTGPVNFTVSPMDLADLDYIDPMGLMIGGHVTPIDHQYYYAKSWAQHPTTVDELRDVHVPAAGIVREVQRMPAEYTTSNLGDYRIIIDHSCTFYTIYIHLNQLSPKLQELVGKDNRNSAVLTAGEVIGKARSFDFSTHNEAVSLQGFVVPEHYDGESWKIHTVDPFDYFTEPLRTELLKKDIRTAIPRGGKIDYDIDGKLIGNWFIKDTGGYSGKNHGEYNYWKTHLAFAPDALDPSHIIVSLGNFKGDAKQFGIKGNAPDPAVIDGKSGLIKYELQQYNYVDSSGKYIQDAHFTQGLTAKNYDTVEGVLLVQLIDKRSLKAEVFPEKTAPEVTQFVKPIIYER